MSKNSILALLLIVFSITVDAQTIEKEKSSFWKVLWGKPATDAITYMPFGTHTYGKKLHKPHPTHYIGYNIKAIEAAAFINSYEDWSITMMYKRQVPLSKKWSIDYGMGLIYGYDGRLVDQPGIPFKYSLFSGPINPIAGGGINYRFSKKWSASVMIAPQINIYGVKYHLE